jgi:hypothetical protein
MDSGHQDMRRVQSRKGAYFSHESQLLQFVAASPAASSNSVSGSFDVQPKSDQGLEEELDTHFMQTRPYPIGLWILDAITTMVL